MIGAAVIEVIVLTGAFWKATGEVHRAQAAAIVQQEDLNGDSGTLTPVNEEPGVNAAGIPWVQKINPFHDAFIMNKPIRPVKKSKPSRSHPSVIQRLNPLRKAPSTTAAAVNNRVTVLSAVFLLFYVGAEVSIGGWIVTFMLRVRGGAPFASGLVSTGFWLGLTIGRLGNYRVLYDCFGIANIFQYLDS